MNARRIVRSRPAGAGSRGGDAEGFTLLDALAALAILSLVMTAVPRSLAGARHMQERSNDWLEARLVAEEVLDRTLGGRDLRPGTYQGELSGRRWRAVLAPHAGVAPATRDGDDRRYRLLDAKVSVAMSAGPLTVATLVIGSLP